MKKYIYISLVKWLGIFQRVSQVSLPFQNFDRFENGWLKMFKRQSKSGYTLNDPLMSPLQSFGLNKI